MECGGNGNCLGCQGLPGLKSLRRGSNPFFGCARGRVDPSAAARRAPACSRLSGLRGAFLVSHLRRGFLGVCAMGIWPSRPSWGAAGRFVAGARREEEARGLTEVLKVRPALLGRDLARSRSSAACTWHCRRVPSEADGLESCRFPFPHPSGQRRAQCPSFLILGISPAWLHPNVAQFGEG